MSHKTKFSSLDDVDLTGLTDGDWFKYDAASGKIKRTAPPSSGGDTSWTAPTLVNSWVNYAGGFSAAGYRKDGSGFVHLKGLVKSGAANTTIFTLPAGYRPADGKIYVTVGASGAGDKLCRIGVYGDGTVHCENISATDYLSLEIAPFLAEA